MVDTLTKSVPLFHIHLCRAYRIQPNLIHNGNPRLLALVLQLQHSRGDIRRGNHIGLGPDTRLDDQRVESVRDQRDSQIDLVEGLVERSIITDIEGDGVGVLEAGAEFLGAFEGAAGWLMCQLGVSSRSGHVIGRHTNSNVHIGLAEDFNGGLRDWRGLAENSAMALGRTEARAEEDDLGTGDLLSHGECLERKRNEVRLSSFVPRQVGC